RSGRPRSSRRVYTVTSCPRRVRAADSSATCTFCPPASTPPSAANGLACSETIAIFIAAPSQMGTGQSSAVPVDDLIPLSEEAVEGEVGHREVAGSLARGAGLGEVGGEPLQCVRQRL